MYCTQCGREIDDAFQFCPMCGNQARPGPSARAAAPRLSRPVDQKMFAGVCAGFARSAGMDVTLMRILWIVATVLTGGVALLVYVGAWIVMPKDHPTQARTAA